MNAVSFFMGSTFSHVIAKTEMVAFNGRNCFRGTITEK